MEKYLDANKAEYGKQSTWRQIKQCTLVKVQKKKNPFVDLKAGFSSLLDSTQFLSSSVYKRSLGHILEHLVKEICQTAGI